MLQAVILHEMGHALGFGTIWTDLNLLADASPPPGTDPHFTGAQATPRSTPSAAQSYVASLKVPVENTGGAGTADAHWRESVFGNELMTGFVDASVNPLSRVTVASMADLGYAVNLADADPYTLAPGLRAFGRGPADRAEERRAPGAASRGGRCGSGAAGDPAMIRRVRGTRRAGQR